MKLIDLTGKKFGKLKVISKSKIKKNKEVLWDCVCDCGSKTTVAGSKLRNGHTKSCGCLHGRGKGVIKADDSWLDDLSGQKFNRLKVISVSGERMPSGANLFLCQCDCGNLTKVSRQSLIKGTTKSCGCYAKELQKSKKGIKNPSYKHGLTRKHPLWDVFHHMHGRCYRQNDKSFKTYGGRGIAICKIWRKKPEVFYKWALSNGYKHGLEIDRINNNGPYGPWNCQFITGKENKTKRHLQKNRFMPK